MTEYQLQEAVDETTRHILMHEVEKVRAHRAEASQTWLAEAVRRYGARSRPDLGETELDVLAHRVGHELFGYGILQELVEDETVTDIDITRFDHVTVRRQGRLQTTSVSFGSEERLLRFCRHIIARCGGKLNETHCHDRVEDIRFRLRISSTIPPRSTMGPTMSIRKHRITRTGIEGLVQEGMLDEVAAAWIRRAIRERSNLLICGKGGAGKTTLLRAVLEEIPRGRRILVCESEAELFPTNRDFLVEKILKRDFGVAVNLADLVRDGLTASLDGYCIGEIVGEEAWEFVKAALTDHTTYATLHARGIREVPTRLKMLLAPCLEGYTPQESLALIGRSLDYVLYLSDFKLTEMGRYIGGVLHQISTGEEESDGTTCAL